MNDAMKKLLYADDLALVANDKQELQETMEEWNGLFTIHGLKLNLEKTDVLHIGHQREELDIELEGKKLTQRDCFVYLGGAVCAETGRRRERYVEECWPERTRGEQLRGDGGPADLKQTGRQGYEHLCHTSLPVRDGNLGTDRTTTTKAGSGDNNWVRQIARVTRADRRRMVELREETGVQRSLTERLVRSRLQWAGHVERMADERLPKRAAELREQGRRRLGRPRLRWEDCVKRDAKKTGEEGDWKKKTGDRGGWKRLADEAVKKLQASPHP